MTATLALPSQKVRLLSNQVWDELRRTSWQMGACRHKDLICTCARLRTLSIGALVCFYDNQNNKGFDYTEYQPFKHARRDHLS